MIQKEYFLPADSWNWGDSDFGLLRFEKFQVKRIWDKPMYQSSWSTRYRQQVDHKRVDPQIYLLKDKENQTPAQ